jgi:hypothetical protein
MKEKCEDAGIGMKCFKSIWYFGDAIWWGILLLLFIQANGWVDLVMLAGAATGYFINGAGKDCKK